MRSGVSGTIFLSEITDALDSHSPALFICSLSLLSFPLDFFCALRILSAALLLDIPLFISVDTSSSPARVFKIHVLAPGPVLLQVSFSSL